MARRAASASRECRPSGSGPEEVAAPAGGQDAGLHGGALAVQPPVDRGGDGVKPAGDRLPLLDGVGGHRVVDGADRVQARLDAVEGEQVVAVVVDLGLQAEPVAHGRGRHPVDVVGGHRLVQLVQGAHRAPVVGLQTGGGEVVVLVLAQVQAEIGGEDRAGLDDGRVVPLGDLVHLGVGMVRRGSLVWGVRSCGHGADAIAPG